MMSVISVYGIRTWRDRLVCVAGVGFVVGGVVLLLQIALVAFGVSVLPRRDVPEWLHVSAADTERVAGEIRFVVGWWVLVFGTLVVSAIARAPKRGGIAMPVLEALVWPAATLVFIVPIVLLGFRGHRMNPPGTVALDSMPAVTDFDYRAFVGDLLPTLVGPTLLAFALAVPLGCLVAMVIRVRADVARRALKEVIGPAHTFEAR